MRWIPFSASSRWAVVVFIVAAGAVAVGIAHAATAENGSISSSAASDPDGITLITLNSENSPISYLDCTKAVADYDLRPGALNSAGLMKIGEVANTSWYGCDDPLAGPLEISQTAEWQVSALTPLTAGEGTVRLDGIAVTAEAPAGACSLSVSGSINAELDLNEKTLTTNPGSADLTVSEVEGCFSQVTNGDKATVEGVFILP